MREMKILPVSTSEFISTISSYRLLSARGILLDQRKSNREPLRWLEHWRMPEEKLMKFGFFDLDDVTTTFHYLMEDILMSLNLYVETEGAKSILV